MNSTETVINTLRKEVASDPTFNDVAHLFASRRRARKQVTVSSLEAKMLREGFKHRRAEYEAVLRRLADLGLGSLQRDARGRVVALKDIKTSLQSIGAAACGQTERLQTFRHRNRFRALPDIAPPPAGLTTAAAPIKKPSHPAPKVVYLIKGGQSMEITAEEAALLTEAFYGPGRDRTV